MKTSIFYNKTPLSIKVKCDNPYEFERHENFDVYAFGIIARELLLACRDPGYPNKNFDFLFQYATKENPVDRPTGEHLLLYSILLEKDYELHRRNQ